jgi:hypothetical protein
MRVAVESEVGESIEAILEGNGLEGQREEALVGGGIANCELRIANCKMKAVGRVLRPDRAVQSSDNLQFAIRILPFEML